MYYMYFIIICFFCIPDFGCKGTTFFARLLSITDNNSFFCLFLFFFDRIQNNTIVKILFLLLSNRICRVDKGTLSGG